MRGNIVFGLVISVLSAALLYYLHNQSAVDAQQAAANIWPFRVTFALLVLGLVITGQSAWSLNRAESNAARSTEPTDRKSTLLMLATVVLSIAYIASLRFAGYMVATYLFLLISFYVLGVKEKLKLFGLPLMMVTIYAIGFSMLLYIPLPRGMGVFRTLSDLIR